MTDLIREHTAIIVVAIQQHVVPLFEIQLDGKNNVLSLKRLSALVKEGN